MENTAKAMMSRMQLEAFVKSLLDDPEHCSVGRNVVAHDAAKTALAYLDRAETAEGAIADALAILGDADIYHENRVEKAWNILFPTLKGTTIDAIPDKEPGDEVRLHGYLTPDEKPEPQTPHDHTVQDLIRFIERGCPVDHSTDHQYDRLRIMIRGLADRAEKVETPARDA